MTEEHAKRGPSGADTWVLCPGSIAAQEGLPNTSSPAAEEGTAAHELLEKCLVERTSAETFRGETFNGYVMTQDFIDAIQPCVDFIESRMNPFTILYAERRVDPGKFLDGAPDVWGTADVTLVHPDSIEVWDLKYGRGVTVEAENKFQLLLYAIGALAELPQSALLNMKQVTVGIMQPRKYHPDGPFRSHTLTIKEILDWVDYFKEAYSRSCDASAPRIPGEKQCLWCLAKGTCRERMNQVKALFDMPPIENEAEVEAFAIREPDSLTPSEVVAVMENADLLRGWLKGVEEYARHLLITGKAPMEISQRFKLVRKKKNKAWVEKDDPTSLGKKLTAKGLKKDQVFNQPTLRTPNQVMSAAKAEGFSERKMKAIESLITVPEGELVVAPVSDPRKAVSESVLEELTNDS